MNDTGPPGPPYPPFAPGSNAIGVFEVGVSPIGSIPLFDPWETIISQYANSPILDYLITSFFAAADPTILLDEVLSMMWDINTAVGYGLDVWGRIVNIGRNLQIPVVTTDFGFEQQIPDVDTFGPSGKGPFGAGDTLTQSYTLTDAAYRQLILAKAAFNITSCTIPEINALLMMLFGSLGPCYVTDPSFVSENKYFGFQSQEVGSPSGQEKVGSFGPADIYPFFGGSAAPMSMSYVFDFTPTPVQRAIIFQSGVLPKPCGVAAYVVVPGQPPVYYNPPVYN